MVKELSDLYLACGVGGMSFIVLVALLVYILKGIYPLLHSIREEGAVTREIIQNNTKAIEKVSESNQNVATALHLLEKSMTNVEEGVKIVRESNDDVLKQLLIIDQKINGIKR